MHVDPFGLLRVPSATATYNAFLDADGELIMAVADMGIQDNLTPAVLRGPAAIEDAVQHASVCPPRARRGGREAWKRDALVARRVHAC